MAWYNILAVVLGAFGGVGGFISLYTAHAKKTGMEVDNMIKVLGQAQEERETMKKNLTRLEERVSASSKRDIIKMRAINSAYRCTVIKDVADCPVIHTLRQECDKNEGVCDVN